MEEDIFLINLKGEKISSETICSHIGLAEQLLKQDEVLKQEFEESNRNNSLEFLLGSKGYIAGSQIGNYYKKITCDSKLIPDNLRKYIQYYCDKGFTLEDLAIEKEKMERGEI